jgi:hypothetical protein
MKRGGGAAKGAAFERMVCKSLSKWLTKGKRDDVFWRVAMSGGRATLQHRKGLVNIAQLGDVGAIDPEGCRITDKFVVECKHVRNLNLEAAFIKRSGAFMRFWYKLLPVCKSHRRQPLFVVCQNRMPVLVVTTASGARTLGMLGCEMAEFHDHKTDSFIRFYLFSDLLKSHCPL